VLFDVIADLKNHGVGIIYISHRMEEIFKITDRISVLRDGQYRGTLNTAETDEDEITQLMIGRKLDLSRNVQHHELGDVALEVRDLSCGDLYKDVSFEVRRGEVVGFYGLVGAGRTEIAETLFGLREPRRARSFWTARRCGSTRRPTPSRGHLAGAGRPQGPGPRAWHELPGQHDPAAGRGPDRRAVRRRTARRSRFSTSIATGSTSARPAGSSLSGNLSGGNQQKIVIGKWLSMHPNVLIVDEPTRGIDVGSKSEIHNLIRELAAQGYAVIVISRRCPRCCMSPTGSSPCIAAGSCANSPPKR
jgi:rhamnose transport system ATP-binding protein